MFLFSFDYGVKHDLDISLGDPQSKRQQTHILSAVLMRCNWPDCCLLSCSARSISRQVLGDCRTALFQPGAKWIHVCLPSLTLPFSESCLPLLHLLKNDYLSSDAFLNPLTQFRLSSLWPGKETLYSQFYFTVSMNCLFCLSVQSLIKTF